MRVATVAALILAWAGACWGQEGRRALAAFEQWRKSAAGAGLEWGEALKRYEAGLRAEGMSAGAVERTLRLVVAYDEAELYDRVYAGAPKFNTRPNRFLVEAVEGVRPGAALDVGMGQGRNAVYLAGVGWKVTGFDVSRVGLKAAREAAAARGLKMEAVEASDEEFDFGRDRWDLIVIVHALEKRSVERVRGALKVGGMVVVEAAQAEPGGYPYGYGSKELLKIFDGFRIVRYEERMGEHDFSEERGKQERLVGLVAQRVR